MNRLHCSILAVTLVGSCIVAQRSLAIEPSEFVLGGVAIGDSEASILQMLGEPNSRDDVVVGVRWTYDGFEVFLDGQGVFEIRSTHPDICTPSDVCPGMDLAAIEQIYGMPILVEQPEKTIYEYSVIGESCWLQIFAQGEIADTLEIVCQP